jgi:tRNA nucleotidyltransferase (CCA-adding enzyme)
MKYPKYILDTIKKLEKNGFEAYLVGGCVRDILMEKEPNDWDMTTDAKPDEVLKIFKESTYENDFGTVLIKIKNNEGETEHVIELTTYRSEKGYSDNRRPDEVKFETELDKDLERRDFTVNAIALKIVDDNNEYVDLFGGSDDIKKKIIRAVGEPGDRFKEDALRMMRAIRFTCQLGFTLEPKTQRAITKLAGSIKFIAKERIGDELIKILKSRKAFEGIILLNETKLLQYIIPELVNGTDIKQNHHHIYTVYKHLIMALKHCPSDDWQVKLACLLHDVGKPKSRKIIKGAATFHNHEYIGERIVRKIVKRLKFSKTDSDRISNLVRNHMFYYNVDEVTEASVRRLIKKAGKDNLKDLIDVRIADRLGSGTPKGKPYKLRHLEYLMKKVQNDPVSVKMLKINGDDLMTTLKIKPGPQVGTILDILLSEVIDDPSLNNVKYLNNRSLALSKLRIDDLRKKAKDAIEEKHTKDDKKMKKEFWVK